MHFGWFGLGLERDKSGWVGHDTNLLTLILNTSLVRSKYSFPSWFSSLKLYSFSFIKPGWWGWEGCNIATKNSIGRRRKNARANMSQRCLVFFRQTSLHAHIALLSAIVRESHSKGNPINLYKDLLLYIFPQRKVFINILCLLELELEPKTFN